MDDDTLWTNFYAAVCYYIEQNGAEIDDTKFSLVDRGDKKTQIVTWAYAFPQPSNKTLQEYKVDDVQDSVTRKSQPDQIQAKRLVTVTETNKGRLPKRKITDGDLIYNQTKKRLEIFIDDAWHGIALVPE
jgi:hypothetical protein